MLKHLRFENFELQEAKLPVRLINITKKWILVQGHGDTRQPHWVKGESKNFLVNWTVGVKGCTFLRFLDEVPRILLLLFGLAIHQNYHQARRRFVEWAQNEIAVVPDFHKRILFSHEAHFWLNGYINKQNCRIWSEANPQVNVETPLHSEKLTVWCALWAGGILLQKR
ncbi:DUF4817 domain-containing protein [Trichonephila clavipes]|nr:DUF4817 domain-containing protein [Trichonephila clavipes]